MADVEQIQTIVKAYILQEFLEGEDPDALTPDTELMTINILDSLSTLKLITFLEQEFEVELGEVDVGEETFNTIADIAILVHSKQ